jgi:hypothetical protein
MTKRGKAHKEAQARQLWCLMSRFESDAGSPNRWLILGDEVTTNPPECRCFASQCAMWRWVADTTGYYALAGAPIISGGRP